MYKDGERLRTRMYQGKVERWMYKDSGKDYLPLLGKG